MAEAESREEVESRTCIECEGTMFPIVIMDKLHMMPTKHRHTSNLEYRLPDDRLSFWTGRYPTAGDVQAFMCAECGHIAMYGTAPSA